jgi:hypothetical protein
LIKISLGVVVHAWNSSVRLRQEDLDFEAALGYIVRTLSQNKQTNIPIGLKINKPSHRP